MADNKDEIIYQEVETDENEMCWSKILLNPVILDNLLKFLPVKDTGNLRCTSTVMNDIITRSKVFSNRTVFKICTIAVARRTKDYYRTMDILETTEINWKNLDIDFDTVSCRKLPECEKLKNQLQHHVQYLKLLDTKKFIQAAIANTSPLVTFLKTHTCQNLSHLSVDYYLLGSVDMLFAFVPTYLQKIDINAKRFKKSEDMGIITSNLNELRKCNSLVQFTIGQTLMHSTPSIQSSIIHILQTNANTLEVLHLTHGTGTGLEDFCRLDMPSLTELKIACENANAFRLNKFLVRQKKCKIEKLTIDFNEKLPQGPMEMIFQSISKWKKSLRILSFYFCSIKDVNWGFIGELEVLWKLVIFVTENGHSNLRIDTFPESLKSVYLEGVMINQSLHTIITNPTFPVLNITEVWFFGCYPFLRDDTMQLICLTMKNLKILKIFYAPLTTYGVTGIPPPGSSLPETGISIANLKYLQILKLSGLVIETYLKCALKFDWLRELNLEDNDVLKINQDFLLTILANNPRIRRISVSCDSLPKYSRGDYTEMKNFVLLRSNGRCCLAVPNWTDANGDEYITESILHRMIADAEIQHSGEEIEDDDDDDYADFDFEYERDEELVGVDGNENDDV